MTICVQSYNILEIIVLKCLDQSLSRSYVEGDLSVVNGNKYASIHKIHHIRVNKRTYIVYRSR